MFRRGEYIRYMGIVHIIWRSEGFEVQSDEQVNLKYQVNESESETGKGTPSDWENSSCWDNK